MVIPSTWRKVKEGLIVREGDIMGREVGVRVAVFVARCLICMEERRTGLESTGPSPSPSPTPSSLRRSSSYSPSSTNTPSEDEEDEEDEEWELSSMRICKAVFVLSGFIAL
jgi:hypothetical protein